MCNVLCVPIWTYKVAYLFDDIAIILIINIIIIIITVCRVFGIRFFFVVLCTSKTIVQAHSSDTYIHIYPTKKTTYNMYVGM